jgi:glycosyltransferase involved in cell wall biosynthesis
VIEATDVTIAVSELEAQAVQALAPDARVEVVPNGVDVDFFRPGEELHVPGYVLFTGLMNYAPNVEGIAWFAQEVLPLVGQVELHVVGSTPAPEVEILASTRVAIHGEVPDTRPYQWRANVVVVPLLSGAGTRLKILEAAACGNAIVSTSVGAEGLDLTPGRDLLIADSPTEFAQAVAAVLGDDALRARLGREARRASERYRWETIGNRMLELVQSLTDTRSLPRAADRGCL